MNQRDQLALAADKQKKEPPSSIVSRKKCDKHMDEHVLVSASRSTKRAKRKRRRNDGAKVMGALNTETRTSSSTKEGRGRGAARFDGPGLLEERPGFGQRLSGRVSLNVPGAHPDAVDDDVWLDAVDVRALDVEARGGPAGRRPVGLNKSVGGSTGCKEP